MKTEWQTKKLGDIGKVLMCKRVFKEQTTTTGDIPFYKIGTFGKEPDAFISNEIYNEFRKKFSFPKKGDILISASGTIGRRVKYDGEPAYFQDSNIVWIDNDEKQVLNDYLYHFYGFCDWNSTKGATISRLYNENLKRIEICFPSISEQIRIVKLIDDVFEQTTKVRENTEKNVQNAKDFFDSYLQDIFSNQNQKWESKKIGEVCNLMTGGTPSRAKKEYFLDGKIKWLVSGDVNKGEIFDCEGRITELGMDSSNTKYLPLNSVVIALNGQGKTRGMVSMLRVKATCNQSVVSIYPKDLDLIIPEYVYFNLKVRYQEIRKMTGDDGNDRRGLNMPLIRNIKINFPKSTAEQKKLVVKFQSLSEKTRILGEVYRRKLKNIEELKKSVLQKAFNGEL